MERFPTLVRVLGFLLVVLGAGLMFTSLTAPGVTFKIGDISFLLSLQFALLVAGFGFIVVPQIPLLLLIKFFPEENAEKLKTILKASKILGPRALPQSSTIDLARRLDEELEARDRRYYLTVLCLLVLLAIISATIIRINDWASATQDFADASQQLISLIHQSRLDFAEADVARRLVNHAAIRVSRGSFQPSATSKIHGLLAKMYSNSILNTEDFYKARQEIYKEEILPFTKPSTGLLRPEIFDIPFNQDIESPEARDTLLTLLAVIANEQGDHGRHIRPYIIVRQLLSLIEPPLEPHESGRQLPSTLNALGVALAEIAGSYDEYEELFDAIELQNSLSASLNESQPISRLRLANLAEEYYLAASFQSRSNFLRARFLNNQVDLVLELLSLVHIERINFSTRDTVDEAFLRDRLHSPDAGIETWDASGLEPILDSLKASLDEATTLFRGPSIYFTRAQLHCLRGRLEEIYPQLQPARYDNAEAAVRDLETAERLQLPKDLFLESRSQDFFLDWLWEKPIYRERLASLSD